MRRKLSSRQTALAKFVIPAAIFAAAAALLTIFFAVPLLSGEPFTLGGALISLVVAGVLIRWGCAYVPLKVVSLDGRHLLVSNYRKEIAVPLSEVKQVAEVKQFEQKLIVLSLKRPTEFGREIKFLPRAQPRLWKEHSVVGELRGLIESRGD
jgi:predicted membrane protein